MKTSRSSLLIALVVVPILLGAEKKITSKVVAVTVYSDRALVTRTFRERLLPGTQVIIFPNLPSTLLDNSLRVGGTSESRARVLDVQVQSVFLDTIPEERVQALMRQLQQLRDERTDVNNRLIVVRGKSATLESIVKGYASSLSNGTTPKATLEDWDRILQFESRIRTDQVEKMTSLERELRVLDIRIATAEQTLRANTGAVRTSVKQVKVTMDVVSEAEISGEVSYVVMDASWGPAYEIRFRTGDSLATLNFAGEVRQSTGEDWKDVGLTLSTAQPSRGVEIPEATPWLVESPRPAPMPRDQYVRGGRAGQQKVTIDQSGRPQTVSGRIYDAESGEPLIGANVVVDGTNLGSASDVNGEYVILGVPAGTRRLKVSFIGYAPVTIGNVVVSAEGTTLIDARLSSTAVQANEVVIMADRPMIQRNTTNTVRVLTPNEISGGVVAGYAGAPMAISVGLGEVQQEITSTSFRIGVPSDVPGDGISHKVTVAVTDLSTAFEYIAVPRRSAYVHLTARVINGATYPLLAGSVNVFTDGAYVSTVSMPSTLPRDTMTMNVGVDEAIKASRTLVKRFKEEVGTFSKSVRYTYEVLLTVQSSRPRPTVVDVREALPYSSDERITVRYLEPPNLKSQVDKSGILSWKPSVRTDGTATLTLKYSIEFPRDKFVPVYD